MFLPCLSIIASFFSLPLVISLWRFVLRWSHLAMLIRLRLVPMFHLSFQSIFNNSIYNVIFNYFIQTITRLDWWTRSWTYEQVVLLQMNSTVSIFLYIFSIFQCRMFIDIFFYLIEWLLHFFNAVEFTELVGRPFARNRQVLEEKLAQMIDVKFIFGKYISISSKSRHVHE